MSLASSVMAASSALSFLSEAEKKVADKQKEQQYYAQMGSDIGTALGDCQNMVSSWQNAIAQLRYYAMGVPQGHPQQQSIFGMVGQRLNIAQQQLTKAQYQLMCLKQQERSIHLCSKKAEQELKALEIQAKIADQQKQSAEQGVDGAIKRTAYRLTVG